MPRTQASKGKVAIATEVSGLGTGVATALGTNVGSAGAPVVNGGALGTPSSGTLTNATDLPEAGLTTADNTTNNVTSTKHGFAPKSPANAAQFLNGAATPAFAEVKDSDLSTTDITTNNASTSKHGFRPKLTNVAYSFFDETGTVRNDVPFAKNSGTASSTTNSATEVNLATLTIPAGAMGPNGYIVIDAFYKFIGTAGTKTPSIRHSTTSGDTSAGTVIQASASGAGTLSLHVNRHVYNTNSASAQIFFPAGLSEVGTNNSAMLTGAINTANASYINFNALVANSGDTAQVVGYAVEIHYGA